MDLKDIARRIAGVESAETAGSYEIELQGPFGDKPSDTGHELEVSIPIFGNEEFFNLLKKSGLTDENIESLKDEDDSYLVTVEPEWSYTESEPSVGWGGGYELEDFEVNSINGIDLLNPKDRAAVKSKISDSVKHKEDDWRRMQEDNAADAKADAMIDSYDDY
jgi:hypothetical protein